MPNFSLPTGSPLLSNHRGVTAALALGAGLVVPVASDAALIVRDINLSTASAAEETQTVSIDLNQDGSIDFQVIAGNVNGFVQTFSKNPWVAVSAGSSLKRFAAGDTVDSGSFGAGYYFGDAYFNGQDDANLAWPNVGDHGYAGVKLDIDGATHYGWLELTRGSLTVGQVGFQTEAGVGALIPGPANQAPEPATLSLLALGALGAAAARRRKRAAA